MKPIKMGLVAAAGKQPEDIKTNGTFDDMHRVRVGRDGAPRRPGP